MMAAGMRIPASNPAEMVQVNAHYAKHLGVSLKGSDKNHKNQEPP